MSAANTLARRGVDPELAALVIVSRMTRSPRGREIEDALQKAYREADQPVQIPRSWAPWVPAAAFDPMALACVARRGPVVTAAYLAARSPLNPLAKTPASFLRAVFLEGDQVLVFGEMRSQGQTLWHHGGEACDAFALDEYKDGWNDGVWFLSNPIDGEWREVERLRRPGNPTGCTRRAEENITSFRHVVVESDHADPSMWLSAIAQMPLPIISLVTSGGKSIHALVRVNARDGDHWRDIVGRIKPMLVRLGADPQAMSAVRLTRLPFCMRVAKGQRQELLFLNPGADGTPIIALPVVRDAKEGA